MGEQPREVVLGALRECRPLVSMRGSESFGIVLLEAWALGKPVVARADTPAFAELVSDGEDGLLVAPEGLAGALRRLLEEKGLAERLGNAGRQKVSRYDWDRIADRIADELSTHCRNR
jgi:glycosyltransferase involved in cell wall biosynthesis